MKARVITRQELYELIWSKPMTKVAKDFDVSDVWISKVCKQADIPRPPVGYWQKLEAGKKTEKKPLPPTKLLGSDSIHIKTKGQNWYESRETPSDEDIVNAPEPFAPVFPESIEDFRQRIEGYVDQIDLPDKLNNIHPMIAKLIQEDSRRVQEKKNDDWGLRRDPEYQSPEGKKLLIALNCLFTSWSRLGAYPTVSSGRDLHCSVEICGSRLSMTFKVIPEVLRKNKPKSEEPSVYEFAWDYEGDRMGFRKHVSYSTFQDITGELLRSLIIESIVLTEEKKRHSAQWSYEYELRERANAANRIEKRRLAEIKRNRIEKEQLIASRLERVDEALVLFDKAEKIRELIAAFDKKFTTQADKMLHYRHWRSWAVDYSDTLDPRHWSASHVENWVASFKLKD